jgi:hypothetical protein
MKYTLNHIVSALNKKHTDIVSSTSCSKDKNGKMHEYIDHSVSVPGKFDIVMRNEVNYSGKRSHRNFSIDSSEGYNNSLMYIKLHNRKDRIEIHKEGSQNVYQVDTDGDYVMMSPGFSNRVMNESNVFPTFNSKASINLDHIQPVRPVLMNAKKKKASLKESSSKTKKTSAPKKKK